MTGKEEGAGLVRGGGGDEEGSSEAIVRQKMLEAKAPHARRAFVNGQKGKREVRNRGSSLVDDWTSLTKEDLLSRTQTLTLRGNM